MITYTATNTKTGQFYIGSAKNYCHYMNRKGNHHVGKPYNNFRKELQANPLTFVWSYSEDDLETRDFEEALLSLYVGSKWCYNECTNPYGFDTPVAKRANSLIKDRSRSEETRRKIGEGNRNPSPEKRKRQSEGVSKTNAKKQPCPQCGMLMNVGNLTKHLKGTRCRGQPKVG